MKDARNDMRLSLSRPFAIEWRTDIGNISCSITLFQPDVMRAHAMKGLELMLRSSSGGYLVEDI